MKAKFRLLLSAALFASASISTADTFYPVAGIASSTQASDLYPAANLIEGPGVGFNAAEPHDRTSTLTWVTAAPGGIPSNYVEAAGMPVLVADLGLNVPLGEISIWGYSDTNANGASRISLKFATAAEGVSGFGASIAYNPVFEPLLDTSPRQSFPFSQTVTARYVQITCEANFFSNNGQGPPPGGDRVGLGEIAFKKISTTAAANLVAPSTQDLLISGLTQTFNIPVLNTGLADLIITGAAFSGTNAAAFSVTQLPPALPSLEEGTLSIQFNPAGLSGTISATMNIASNDPDSPVTVVALTGKFPSFYPIISATSSTAGDVYPAGNLIQGPGIGFQASTPFTKLLTGPTGNWVTAAPGGPTGDYIAAAGTPVLTFDLGASVLLNEISVWGYDSANANGLREFSLKFATEAEGTPGFGTSITYNPVFGSLSNAATVRQSFTFGLPVTCRYVEMTCLDNFYGVPGAPAGGDRVGAGEVAFQIPKVSAVADIDAPLSQVLAPDGTVQDFNVNVQNTGLPDLNISSINFTGANAAAFTVVTVPSPLLTLRPANIVIRFNPAGLAGPVSATMNILSNDPDESPASVSLSGLLHDPRLIVANPAALGIFPGGSGPQNINLSVQNTGLTRSLTITGSTVSGTNAANFSVLSIPGPLAPGATGNIVVRFDPQGATGGFKALLDLASNDPAAAVMQIVITARTAPANTLAAFWPLDDSADAVEIADAAGAHPGLPSSVTLFQPGARPFSGTSAQFDGFSTINVPWSADINPPAFTVVAWANSAGGGDYNSVITSRSDNNPNLGGYVIYDDNNNNWVSWTGAGVPSNGWNIVTGPAVVPEWTHLALVYDDLTQSKSLYVNGTLAASATINIAPNGSLAGLTQRDLHIGSGGNLGTQYFFNGGIDEVAIFNIPLSPANIVSIRDNGVAAFAGLTAPSFFITGIVRNANGSVAITFDSESGRTYTVERSTSVSGWTEIPGTITAAGSSTTYTDTTLTGSPPRVFYRIVRK